MSDARFAFEREKKKKRGKNPQQTPASYEFINSDNKGSGDLASVIHISQSLAGQK